MAALAATSTVLIMPAVFDAHKLSAVLQALRHADGARVTTSDMRTLLQGLGDAFNIQVLVLPVLKSKHIKGASRELTAFCSLPSPALNIQATRRNIQAPL
jgi:hypothetical protein